ncbi:MAG TPA: glycosyltransferase [Fimbriimonas sp.]
MNVKIFCHSLLSDWNHGNAHFLRGVVKEFQSRRHRVDVFEPEGSWSLTNLLEDRGLSAIEGFRRAYPTLDSVLYDPRTLDLDRALEGADLVLVHEWSDHELVRRIGRHRRSKGGYRLLFHDTHHRSVTDRSAMQAYDLSGYDGVLAFGEVVRRVYLENGWARRAWTWHEAADPEVFHPFPGTRKEGDLVWVGNWGDEERTEELHEFLLEPAKALGLKAKVYGVRYPEHALKALAQAGIEYGGSLANYEAPRVYSRYRATVHVPRRPYVRSLPGIPTIRVFEALASGIPLVCAPWSDAEGLFTPGEDYLVARDGAEMQEHLRRILEDEAFAAGLAKRGRRTVLARHTCAHRVDELLRIFEEIDLEEETLVTKQ